MACKVLKLIGYIDGEKLVNASGTEYVAGQPVKLGASGLELATAPGDVHGIAKNDRRDDLAVGPQAADAVSGGANGSVIKGTNPLQMTPGKLADGSTRNPWKTTPTHDPWAVGQHIFVASDGTWDNAPASANQPPMGQVTKAPASTSLVMEADVNTTLGTTYSSVAT